MVPSLAEDYRVYAPDRPGRGLSAAPSYRGRDLRRFPVAYLVELFDDLGLDRPHVAGNSLGGQQAFLLAIDHDRVDRLPLVGAPGGLSREFPPVFRLLTVHGVSRLLYWLNARESVGRFVVDDSGIPEAFYETLAAAESLPGRAESLRSLNLEQGSFGRMHPVLDISDEVVDIRRPTGCPTPPSTRCPTTATCPGWNPGRKSPRGSGRSSKSDCLGVFATRKRPTGYDARPR